MNRITIVGIIYFFVLIVGLSGCIDSIFQKTSHFDNGVFAFDYPSNLQVKNDSFGCINVYNGSNIVCALFPSDYNNIDLSIESRDFNITIDRSTINGRKAYTVSQNKGGNICYFTAIDKGNGYINIMPTVDTSKQNQKYTSQYKTYLIITNTFQIK